MTGSVRAQATVPLWLVLVVGLVAAGLAASAPVGAAAPSQWVQLGADIDGEFDGDFSSHVAMNEAGDMVVVGASGHDGFAERAGYARVFRLVGDAWVQVGGDIDGQAAHEASGQSVAMNALGDMVVVAAPENGGRAGAVRVYRLEGQSWVQVGSSLYGEAATNFFGSPVSMSADGHIIVVGAPQNDGNGDNAGRVQAFQLVTGDWVQLGSNIDGNPEDYSGESAISADGNTIAVGANSADGNGARSGRVRVFELLSGEWVQTGSDIDGEAAQDRSSTVALSADGDTVAVGAGDNDGSGNNAGHVRVFRLSGGEWVQIGSDIDGEAARDRFGRALDISADGESIIVGSAGNDGNGSGSGHARVFSLVGGEWVQVGADIDGEAADDWSGWSVAMSDDGGTVVIGAPQNDGGGNGRWAGHARVFSLDDSGPTCFGQPATIVGTDGDDELIGTPADDVIVGLAGRDLIRGMGGHDVICGGDHRDRIYGNGGDDQIDGGAGDDFVSGNRGADVINGGNGNDTLKGSSGDDTLRGGVGHDRIFAGGGDDTAYGDTGNDVIAGNDGTDTCDGGPGANTIRSCELPAIS